MDRKLLFLQWLTDNGLSPQTIKDYSYSSKFFREDLDQIDLDEFIKRHNRTIDRACVKNYIEFLLWKYPEEREKYINLRVPRLKGRKKRILPDFPTEEEVWKIESVFEKPREKVMLLISFYSALRPQGVLKLMKSNFYLDDWLQDESKPCKIKINEKGNKERIVFLKANIMQMLKNPLLKIQGDKRLFGIKYRRWHFLLTEASKKALGRSISPHKLRHGGATLLLRNGWTLQEVSEFLGHESIATTQIYAHLDKDEMMKKYEKL